MTNASEPSSKPVDLAVIIVTRNDCRNVDSCLKTVYANKTTRSFVCVVVDNGSSDSTVQTVIQKYPDVVVLRNGDNLGYPKANNLGLRQTSSEYALLLNPDTELPADCFEVLLDFMDSQSKVGVVGPKLVKQDGSMDIACRRMFPNYLDHWFAILSLSRHFPTSRLVGRYNMLYCNEDELTDVESVAGAFLLARRSAIAQVGLLDEQFFIYGEDLDWCYRFVLANWRVVYNPAVTVMHIKGGTTRTYRRAMLWHFYRSSSLLYRKYLLRKTNVLLNMLVLTAGWCRYGIIVVRGEMNLVIERLKALLRSPSRAARSHFD